MDIGTWLNCLGRVLIILYVKALKSLTRAERSNIRT